MNHFIILDGKKISHKELRFKSATPTREYSYQSYCAKCGLWFSRYAMIPHIKYDHFGQYFMSRNNGLSNRIVNTQKHKPGFVAERAPGNVRRGGGKLG
jgi:hypothetical protein